MPRRRKKRHVLNPARYLTPEVVKAVALCAVASLPGMKIGQTAKAEASDATEKLGYANANTNAALSIVALLADRLDKAEARIARLERKSPAAMVGPDVPAGWLPQPVKKHSRWRFWERG